MNTSTTPGIATHRAVRPVAREQIVNHHCVPSSIGNTTVIDGIPDDDETGRSDSVSALWRALQDGVTLEIAYQAAGTGSSVPGNHAQTYTPLALRLEVGI